MQRRSSQLCRTHDRSLLPWSLGRKRGTSVRSAHLSLVSVSWSSIPKLMIRKHEHPLRIAVFVTADAVAQIVGALLLFGLGGVHNAAIAGWRISFLVAGALTIIIGGIFLLVVPVSPHTAWFLNDRQKYVAVERVAREHASGHHTEWRWDQMYDTLRDPLVSRPLVALLMPVLPDLCLGFLHLRHFGRQLWLNCHQRLWILPTQDRYCWSSRSSYPNCHYLARRACHTLLERRERLHTDCFHSATLSWCDHAPNSALREEMGFDWRVLAW